jgi:hypothetical protein
MPRETFIEKKEENISIHIFSVSAAMIGVCLTVIGILNLVSSFKKIQTLCDEITAVDAIFFLIACVISYTAIRTKTRKRRYLLEKLADYSFIIGLLLMVVTCLLIVYELV